MSKIQLLDNATIDKIAAGEVVERPSSVVKELVENAIDAGATAISIEIKEGGISFIRVTDNGNGIPAEQVKDAFLRHATSKIRSADDLHSIHSLGFRGEALSSISAVSQVEIMTKKSDALLGIHYVCEGGAEKDFSQVGIPNGTTILVKNLFYNTPARRKFLKSPITEGGYIADLCEHLAMSKPDIAFRFISNNQLKFHTSGNGDIREIIYRIFGKSFIQEIIPIDVKEDGIQLKGFLGKPSLNRSNRNFENCFINGRYVKSNFLYRAIEEGYKPYLMQHKFPFAVLYFLIDTQKVDVNVHPTKMDIRITDSQFYYDFIVRSISKALQEKELIPDMEQSNLTSKSTHAESKTDLHVPEPFEQNRIKAYAIREDFSYEKDTSDNKVIFDSKALSDSKDADTKIKRYPSEEPKTEEPLIEKPQAAVSAYNRQAEQLNLFTEKILTLENKDKFEIMGQVFQTYWLVRYEDKLLFVDQHAAHEKVKYEKLMSAFHSGEVHTQSLQPPFVFHLTQKEESVLEEFQSYFEKLGFIWEDFGNHSIAIREIPFDLYGKNEKSFFENILDELVEEGCKGTPDIILEKIASMACKSAVKGNQTLSFLEMKELLIQLFDLDNPYHCPHGRPTIISMSKSDLEKKFKRIV